MESENSMRLIHHYLIESAQQFPTKDAIICDDKILSYMEFMERIKALSIVLSDYGLRKRDRALILLGDKTDFLVACYAVIARGSIAVPLLEGSALQSIEQITSSCSPHVLLTSKKDLVEYPFLRDRLPCGFLMIDDMPDSSHKPYPSSRTSLKRELSQAKNDSLESGEVAEDDGALILFTSGTSGKKKGVLLSHKNLVQTTLNINDFMRIDSNIREFVAVPLAHSFGFGRSRCVLFAGGTLVFINGMLNPVGLVQSVLEHQCNAISSVPSGFAMFLGRLEAILHRVGPQIRFIELGSSPMPLDHKIKLLEIFPNARICMHYGLTEASRSTFIEFRTEQRKLHTVGRPSPNVSIAIEEEGGRRLDPMHTGEILVRGGHVALGYWENDELNRQRYTSDGWFKTGDYGYLDEEGYLSLLGRKDEIINMGGVKISPLEVEERIREAYPDWDICVVGVPDPAGIVGEIPVLCYISKDGRTITPSDLSQVLRTRLDRNKIPRVVYRIEALPRSENAKILRRELRQKIVAGDFHKVQQT
jgi:long-chain acyl-CoA synthetase